MILLALDSASAACSVAIAGNGGKILAHRFEAMERGQAEALTPMIDAMLGEAGINAGALDAIAVTTGPGAFTGVRIGLSAARALGLATARPVLGFTTFEAVVEAQRKNRGEDILCVIESRRADYFVQMFDRDTVARTPPVALGVDAVVPYVAAHRGRHPESLAVCGDGAQRLMQSGIMDGVGTIDTAPAGPDALHVATLAYRRLLHHGPPPPGDRPSPLYLRPPDIRRPGNSQDLRKIRM